MKAKRIFRQKNGQSMVEFALILPLLLLLILGMAEVGYAFYDYLVVASANREGARLASRGRFEQDAVIERVIAAGGNFMNQSGEVMNNLRTEGDDANFGMIMTIFPINRDGILEEDEISAIAAGVIVDNDGNIRPITPGDNRIVGDYQAEHGDITAIINEIRDARDYEAQRSDIVVIETFFAHEMLFPPFLDLLNLPNPTTLYFSSSMRIMRDARID